PIGIPADKRLQNRSRHLKGERDEADLHEAEMEARFEERINCRDERLDGVVEEVGKTDRKKNRECSRVGRWRARVRLTLREVGFGDARRHGEEQKLFSQRSNANRL